MRTKKNLMRLAIILFIATVLLLGFLFLKVPEHEAASSSAGLGSWLKQMLTGDRKKGSEKPGTKPGGITAGEHLEHITVGGEERTYLAYVPAAAVAESGDIDLLIALHGMGGDGEGVRSTTGFDAYADERGFVVVYPNALEQNGAPKWDPSNRRHHDIDFIEAIIAEVTKLSGNRIGNVYIAGFSNGSVMAQAAACLIEDIDGVAAGSAGLGPEMLPYCDLARPLPYIGFYGTEDHFDEMDKYEASVAHFAAGNGCADSYTAEALPNTDPNDGTTVELRVYNNADGTACVPPVHYYRITGGGHFWPGSTDYTEAQLQRRTGSASMDIDGSELVVDFFNL